MAAGGRSGFPGETICCICVLVKNSSCRLSIPWWRSLIPLIVGGALHQLPFQVASRSPDVVKDTPPFTYEGGMSPPGLAYVAMSRLENTGSG